MISRRISKDGLASGHILRVMKGPIKGRNWHYTADDPMYKVVQNGSAVVAIDGTNDIAARSGDHNVFTRDLEPAEGATWTEIESGASDFDGDVTVEYEFLRLRIKTAGTGNLFLAWVRWR